MELLKYSIDELLAEIERRQKDPIAFIRQAVAASLGISQDQDQDQQGPVVEDKNHITNFYYLPKERA